MDVYRQAAEVVRAVKAGEGTAKALCLQKHIQKKKQTYAVVCETLRHYELLDDVLNTAQFFEYFPHSAKNKDLLMCLSYDAVVGKGINTKQHDLARAVQTSLQYLREAYFQVKGRHTIAPRETEQYHIPRYVRVNPLHGLTDEDVWKGFHRRRRDEDEGNGDEEAAEEQRVVPRHRGGGSSATMSIKWDEHIPSLLVFPPNTDLHRHPLVRHHHVVLQDKASCLPAAVLMEAVPVRRYDKEGKKSKTPFKTPTYVIDACAAPGNKTTHLAALGKPTGIQLMAMELDEKRAQLLEKRAKQFGAEELINVINGDFCALGSDERAVTEAILLDPSCSASGVVSRVDISLGNQDDEETAQQRVDQLAAMQRKMVAHALLSFDRCWRVVYSTCSIHQRENEDVVVQIMTDERVQKRGWRLSNIMPKTWNTRGVRTPLEEGEPEGAADVPVDYCIRCDPTEDHTNGFFVACFDRDIPGVTDDSEEAAPAQEAEKEQQQEEPAAANDDEGIEQAVDDDDEDDE